MPALDGLRAVAILLVIALHTASWTRLAAADWIVAIFHRAQCGVQLFFVVSAFTLTLRAPRNGSEIVPFAIRRICRIGPGYWLAALGYTVIPGLLSGTVDWHAVAIAGLFLTTWQHVPDGVVPGGWSVCSEALFYLMLPLIAWLIGGRLWRAVAIAFIAFVAAQIQSRALTSAGLWDFNAYIRPLQQAPVFMFGVAGAIFASRFRIPRVPGLAAALLVLMIVVLPTNHPYWGWTSYHVAFSAMAAVVVMQVAVHPPRFLANPLARKIGEVSYSMYLIHFVLFWPFIWVSLQLAPFRLASWFLVYVVVVAIAFAISCVSYAYIERPAMRWAARVTERMRRLQHRPVANVAPR